MKLTKEKLKQIIKEELQSMQEVDEQQPTLESIKAELYNLHKQLAQDGVKLTYKLATDPTVTADKFENHSQTAFNIMKKLEDFLLKTAALATPPSSP